MRWTMAAMVLVGCDGELEPGDPGYEDCDEVDLHQEVACEPVELCCKQTDISDVRCRYVTPYTDFVCETDSVCDERFNCDTEESCEGARLGAIADACEL